MLPTSVLTESTSEEVEKQGERDATSLELLSRALSGAAGADAKSQGNKAAFAPPVPETLEDTGLSPSLVQQLILKKMYSKGDMLGRDLSEALGLKFSLIEGIIDFFKQQHFIEAKRSLGMGNSTVSFADRDRPEPGARVYGGQPVHGAGARSATPI
jgi:hypothetical protein